MIPRLYAPGTTAFENEGLGALSDCLSCEASNAINGLPELNLTYPAGGIHADEIGERCIIVADMDHNKGGQPYIVKEIDKTTPGALKIYAVHLAYDLLDGTGCSVFSAADLTSALAGLRSNATHQNGVTLTADFTYAKAFTHRQPSSVKTAIGGMEGSILDTYGGELDFDKLTLTLRSRLGANNGVIIRWGKNLQQLNMNVDWSGVCTGIYPFWTDLDKTKVVQMDPPVYSLGTFGFNHTLVMDLSAEFMEEPTSAQLLAWVTDYANNHTLTSPKISWNVRLKELRNTPEFADVAILEQVGLGDTVRIYLKAFGVNASARIVSERYDVLREQYNDLTIGSVRASLASTMVAQAKETASAISGAETTLADAIRRATDLITGNSGGYIVTVLNAAGEPQEQLIMDNPDITQAQKVWRWNLNGLGYSSTGYAGPYTTAVTSDGEIVADFIKTGTLDAAQINVINLIAEHVRATSGNAFIDIESANMKMKNGNNWTGWFANGSSGQGVLFLYGGTRPNMNADADDPGNDSTSRETVLDANGLAVGLDVTNTPKGTLRAGSAEIVGGMNAQSYYGAYLNLTNQIFVGSSNGYRAYLDENGRLILRDANLKGRVDIYGENGSLFLADSAEKARVALRGASGNIQSYDSTGQERIGLYPAEGQLSLYNASGTRTVQIRGDGTASGNPLPVNQGGTGHNDGNLPWRSITSAPTDTACGFFFRVTSAFTVYDGTSSNTLTIPNFTHGFFSASGGDAVMVCVDSNLNHYYCYRNGSTWRGKKL